MGETNSNSPLCLLECLSDCDNECGIHGPYPLYCTRNKNHSGPHVACLGDRHEAEVWEQTWTEEEIEQAKKRAKEADKLIGWTKSRRDG